MKKILSLLLVIFLINISAFAKVWRVNNTPGVAADFNSCVAALASASVLNDDTLHIEGTATPYVGFTLSKRLVIIGTGYFLSGVNSNSGLQANPYSSSFNGGYIIFDSTSSGSVLIGLDNFAFMLGPNLGSATDNITLLRCRVLSIGQYYGYTANSEMTGWRINKCYFNDINLSPVPVKNWEISNTIFTSSILLDNSGNLNNLIRNNVFRSTVTLLSAYFSNNIISTNGFVANSSAIKNNISSGTNLPAGNGNLNNQSDAVVFVGLTGNSTDGQWQLKPASPAIAAGETIAGVTPDCGAFGTPDPYVLSGIPPIPTIYQLTVPSTVASTAPTMPVTISTRSNN